MSETRIRIPLVAQFIYLYIMTKDEVIVRMIKEDLVFPIFDKNSSSPQWFVDFAGGPEPIGNGESEFPWDDVIKRYKSQNELSYLKILGEYKDGWYFVDYVPEDYPIESKFLNRKNKVMIELTEVMPDGLEVPDCNEIPVGYKALCKFNVLYGELPELESLEGFVPSDKAIKFVLCY